MLVNDKFKAVNFSKRTHKINYVILHYTEVNFAKAVELLTQEQYQVSAHYLIKEDGEIFQLVQDQYIAWHAGNSCWQGKIAMNEYSLGIELDNNGKSEFTKLQIDACLELCEYLKKKYHIKTENFLGHSDVAPMRKIDPGIFFPWHLFAKHNMGFFPKISELKINKSEDKILAKYDDQGLPIERMQAALKNIGYNIAQTGKFDAQTNVVIRSFQARYYPSLLRKKGLHFYNNMEAKYDWTNISQKILELLMHISSN